MMDHMISMFIDNELDLNDKIEFVKIVHADGTFRDQTVDLLVQEKLIRSEVVKRIPQVKIDLKTRVALSWRPMALWGSTLAAALILLFFSFPSQMAPPNLYRFVIYQPDISHAEITGSFTAWQNIPLKRVGDTGYWEIMLKVPKGEHRFSYILDRRQRFSDPTVPGRELDDFGGENSILVI